MAPSDPGEAAMEMVSPLAGPVGMLRRGGVKGIEVAAGAAREKIPALFDLNAWRRLIDDPELFFHGTRAEKPFEYSEGFLPSSQARASDDAWGGMSEIGSGADPSAFMGTSFSDSPQVANKFAEGRLPNARHVENARGRIIPSKLDLKNPKYFKDDYELQDFVYQQNVSSSTSSVADDDFLQMAEEFAGGVEAFDRKYNADVAFRESVNRDVMSKIEMEDETGEIAQAFAEELAGEAVGVLRREGFDGVIHKNIIEGGNAVIVFDPEKILMGIGQ